MGLCSSSVNTTRSSNRPPLKRQFSDYKTRDQLHNDMITTGIIEDMSLIVGIDATGSNRLTGEKCYGGKSLHDLSFKNPYMSVISLLPKLFRLDTDHTTPMYYFGSQQANNNGGVVHAGNSRSVEKLLEMYKNSIQTQTLSGPTSFVNMIETAIAAYGSTQRYQVLIIVTDGAVNDREDTMNAIIAASNYPISIIGIGVGDGPFDQMEKFDDEIPKGRKFDNFQFVNYNKLVPQDTNERQNDNFMFHAFMEVPRQYDEAKRVLNYKPFQGVQMQQFSEGPQMLSVPQYTNGLPQYNSGPQQYMAPPQYAP
jgi:E3 ubiquitin-protein ligase RGLG